MRQHYTPEQLLRAFLRDLVVDLRALKYHPNRDLLYYEETTAEFRTLWAARHDNFVIGPYGYPCVKGTA